MSAVRATTTRTAIEVAAVSGWLATSDLAFSTVFEAAIGLLGLAVVLLAALIFVPSDGPLRRLTHLVALARREPPPEPPDPPDPDEPPGDRSPRQPGRPNLGPGSPWRERRPPRRGVD